MRNKNGFISMGVIYSFFLVFIVLVLGIVATYSSRRILLNNIKKDVRKVIDEIYTYDCFRVNITELDECIKYVANINGEAKKLDKDNFALEATSEIKGIYRAEDNYGESYYYRGDVSNNYVQFGRIPIEVRGYLSNNAEDKNGNGINDSTEFKVYKSLSECNSASEYNYNCVDLSGSPMYWRIIRVNGDGTIRLIYAGLSPDENAPIGNSYFDDNDPNGRCSISYIGSTVEEIINEWYVSTLEHDYKNYLANSTFCNDREFNRYDYYTVGSCPTSYTTSETTNYNIVYQSINRYENKAPSLKCNQSNDLLEQEADGLTYPIGIITADEIFFSGGTLEGNDDNYLNTDYSFWTMTPYDDSCNICCTENGVTVCADADMWNYKNGLKNADDAINSSLYIRPVINLRSDIKIKSGKGSKEKPYILEEVDF